MAEYEYRRSFEDLDQLVETIRAAADSKKSLVFRLSWAEQVYAPDAYVKKATAIQAYRVPDQKINDQFLKCVLAPETLQEVKTFRKQSFADGSMNGRAIVTKVFPTNIEGLSLQVVYLEEWWQAMGGGHVGDAIDIWLVHHEQFLLVSK